jgi:hypothetical protein
MIHPVRMRLLPGLTLALLMAGSGCSKNLPQNDNVEGTVKIDGIPLVGVVVQFVPDGAERMAMSSGVTDERGHYSLKCENNKPGALLGSHHVLVNPGRPEGGFRSDDPQAPQGEAAAAAMGGPKPDKRNPRVPSVYLVASKTPLVVDVKPDQHTYDLNLTARQ